MPSQINNLSPLFDGASNPYKTDWMSEYLLQSDLDNLAADYESWEIEGSNAELSYFSHGFFRYFGKFPPPVATRFIQEFHNPDLGPIVDPMVGSGTTLVEAILLGTDAIGIDVNPLSLLISKVKTTYVPKSTIMRELDRYLQFMHSSELIVDSEKFIPNDRYLNHWFYPETQQDLARTRHFIEGIEDSDIQDLFKVALASNVRRFSRASNGLGRMFLDPAIPPQDVPKHVSSRITDMATVLDQLKNYSAHMGYILQDSRQQFLEAEISNLVICHPPYFNLYKYSSIYKFEMLWTGFDYLESRRQEIKEGFKMGKRELVEEYVSDLVKVVENIARILVPGGYCVLMMGDTLIHEKRVNTTSLTWKKIQQLVPIMQLEKIIIRQPKFTEASYAATQRRSKDDVGIKLQDHLLVMRKANDAS